jgi:intergrase/recombinase
LSALAKFLGVYEEFKGLVKGYGLKWASTSAEDLIIARLNKTAEKGNIQKWIDDVKSKLPELACFIDFMLVTGLRYEETLNSYNSIIDLAKTHRLSDYYNAKQGLLEHYRLKNLFIRRTKKAFVSFLQESFISKISEQDNLTRPQIDNRVKRKGFKCRFSDIREYFATYMTKYLNPAEIDFLQGRVSGSVFMRNYFNPALITDLKERTFKAIGEIQTSLKS